MSFISRLTVAGRQAERERAEGIVHEDFADNQVLANGKKKPLLTMPVVACGAGLFSDGYINNVGPSSR